MKPCPPSRSVKPRGGAWRNGSIGCALLLALSAMAASAQERPPTSPGRDVDVTYQIAVGPKILEERWRFLAAAGRSRVDVDPRAFLIADRKTRTATMVDVAAQSALDIPMRSMGPGDLAGSVGTRLGSLEVAGLPCTEWQLQDNSGRDVIGCFTGDGIMLRARRGDRVAIQASRVSFDAQDPANFQVPPGFKRETVPRAQ